MAVTWAGSIRLSSEGSQDLSVSVGKWPRFLLDASATFAKHLSLNMLLYPGTNLNPKLFDVLCRFRLNIVAFIADIKKASLQIEFKPDDNKVIRFF